MKLLAPIKVDGVYVDLIEEKITEFFRLELYAPLMLELRGTGFEKIENSAYDLLMAIDKGRVSFYRGHFKGKFNAGITRELKKIGAKWDRKYGSFRLPASKLPLDVKIAISTSEATWLKKTEAIKRKMAALKVNDIVKKLDLTKIVSKAVWQLDGDITKSLNGIVVVPKLTEENKKHIAENYTENMRLYISDWTEDEVSKLRATVEKSVFSGKRYEELAKTIKRSYGVSKSKATFLARQETNLLVSKFKESRYNEVGVTDYIWTNVVGSHAHPVRDRHKWLNGQRFRFDNPPVVNEKGDRKNPGEDYNCRCTARAVVEF